MCMIILTTLGALKLNLKAFPPTSFIKKLILRSLEKSKIQLQIWFQKCLKGCKESFVVLILYNAFS